MERENRDGWSVFEIMTKAIAGILIPVAIFVVGSMITSQQRQTELTLRETERVTNLIRHLASENEDERLLAIETIDYYSAIGQFPSELVAVLISIVRTDTSPQVAGAASRTVAKVADQNPDVARIVEGQLSDLPLRVYVHIRKRSQADLARRLSESLEQAGYAVPREPIMVNSGPRRSQVRFFSEGERSEGQALVDLLKGFGVETDLTDLSSWEPEVALRAGHFELWLAPGVQTSSE